MRPGAAAPVATRCATLSYRYRRKAEVTVPPLTPMRTPADSPRGTARTPAATAGEPRFPFTFSFAARTFSVVSNTEGGDGVLSVYVRIVGQRGLHDFGPLQIGETEQALRLRICRWYSMAMSTDGATPPGTCERCVTG